MVVSSYVIGIDTNSDGDYADSGEDVSSRVRANPGIAITRGRDQAREISPPRAGTMGYELDNRTGTYGPSSAYKQGLKTRVTANYSATNYALFEGRIETFDRHPEKPRQSVSVEAIGPLSLLANRRGLSSQVYTSIDTGTAIQHLLEAAGLTSSDWALDTGKTTLNYWWLDPSDTLIDALNALLATEGPGAAVYEGAGSNVGKIVFKNRHARITETVSTAVQQTFRGTGTEPVMNGAFIYNDGQRDRINSAACTVYVRTAATLAAIWTYGQTVTLAAGETRLFTVRQTSSVPFTGAVTPVAATDYTLTTGALTTVSLDRTSGSVITLTLTADTAGATLTGLRVRAQSLAITSSTGVKNSVTPDEATPVRPLPSTVSILPDITQNDALDLLNAYVAFYQAARPTMMFTVTGNRHADAMTACLSLDIGHRVTVIESGNSINTQAHVQQVRHVIDGGPKHATTFGVEAVSSVGAAFIIDTSTVNSSTDRIWF